MALSGPANNAAQENQQRLGGIDDFNRFYRATHMKRVSKGRRML